MAGPCGNGYHIGSPTPGLAGYQRAVERERTMAEITLVAEVGRKTGSAESRRLRHEGRVPAVVYGHGMDPVPVSVVGRELRAALAGHGTNQVLTLDVAGTKHMVLPRQLQRHPVRRTVAHVDFQVVSRDEIVHADVSIVLTGTATEVERDRGMVEHVLTSLAIRSTPDRIPEEIALDVSGLSIGEALRVRDLVLPAGVTTDVDPDEAVVIASAPAMAATPETEGAAEETGEESPAGPAEG